MKTSDHGLQPIPAEPVFSGPDHGKYASDGGEYVAHDAGTKKWHFWSRSIKAPGVVLAVCLIIAGIAGLAYAAARESVVKDTLQESAGIQLNASRAIDSPIGFLPGFESVKSGKARIVIDGIGVAPKVEKDVAFYVDDEGAVAFDMLPDDPSVNETLKYLTERDGATYDPASDASSRFMKLDFLTLFDLYPLVSTHADLYNGLLAAYDTGAQVKGASGLFKPSSSTACATAADALRPKLQASALNTQRIAATNPVQSIDENGNATLKFTVEPAFFAETDAAVKNFITVCYAEDSGASQADVGYLQQLIQRYTTHPTYTFSVKVSNSGTKSLDISAAYATTDTSAHKQQATFRFELLDTGAPEVTVEEPVKSFFERPNLYGMVYSYCRVPPLVARGSAGSKLLITRPASADYNPPSSYDLVYACSSKDTRLADYSVMESDLWTIGGRPTRLKKEASQQALRQQDIAVAIEHYFRKNGYYPSIETVQAGQLPGLQSADLQDKNGQLINKGDITYNVEPENCSECMSYSLEYKVDTNITLRIKDYARQGGDR